MGKEKVTYWVRRASAEKYKVDPLFGTQFSKELAIVVKVVEKVDKLQLFAYFEDSEISAKNIGCQIDKPEVKEFREFIKKNFREATEVEAVAFLL